MDISYEYTKEDFNTPAPYEYITSIKDLFKQNIEENSLNEYALSVGFKQFKKSLKSYRASLKSNSIIPSQSNVTAFDYQENELETGDWFADETGIYRYGKQGALEYACTHPIIPTLRLRNIDTGEQKIKIAFRRGDRYTKHWTEITTDCDTILNSKNIINLAKVGVSVSSGNRAQNLVDYLRDVIDRNYDTIPECKSVTRLGWTDEGFSPYVDELVFDGNANFSKSYEAVTHKGDVRKWLAEAVKCRKYNVTAHIVLASSFASVLVKPLGCLPFFVHLWGMDSGTGKSVSQMLAASVWGEPTIGGDYFKTFKSTTVGFEIFAGFLNSLPMVIDELQLAKDSKGRVIFNVYELASGSGKVRSNKALGISKAPMWANCFITSGETPIVGEQDGAGAVNRVIEVECKAENKVIDDGRFTAGLLKENYGYAGEIFVDNLNNELDKSKKLYDEFYAECINTKATSKQAMAAALILTADTLATEWIFKDGNALKTSDISEFLKSAEAVSASTRGYNYMCDWVAVNSNKFGEKADKGEIYGVIEDGYAYIIRSVFNKACADAAINAKALLSHLQTKGLIKTRGRAMTMPKRLAGIANPVECVVMSLPNETGTVNIEDDYPDF